VSEDGSRARVVARVRDDGQRAIGALVDRIEARLSGTESVVGGEAYRTARGLVRLVEDLTTSLALAVLVIFVMLGLLLRSARLALISVLPNVLPLALTLAYMSLRGIPLQASTAIVFSVSIGLVVDGTIHILARYREEIARGVERRPALMAAMCGSGRAVVIGALTLLLGFIALLFASFVPIRLFAELSIVAIATSLLAELLVLPALLALFGPRPARVVEGAPREVVAASAE
jgi:predicted RND superfamily exporter protein